jgi:hypothetical protein
MGLLDSLFPPLSFEKFAHRFIGELKKAGVVELLSFDTENGRILRGAGKDAASIYMANFYQEYLSLPRSKRGQYISARARLFATENNDLPDDFESARSNLRPKVWVRVLFENTRLQTQIDGGDSSKFDAPEYEIGSHLVASLVYDLPETMRSISNANLRDWGVSYYEALEVARENLEQEPYVFAQIGEGCYASSTGDNYDACRLLIPTLMEKLTVKGDVIAMVPNRDTLLVAGSEDEPSLAIMLALAKKANEEMRPMVPIPLRLDGDAWVDWLPDRSHPLAAGFQELAMRFLNEQYGEQKELLEKLTEKNQDNIFVASYSLIQKDDGSLYSYAVWCQDVETWLPRTEWVMFFRGEDDVPAIARWEMVEQVVGRLMQPTEHYPARFHVAKFPSEAELAALGKAEF